MSTPSRRAILKSIALLGLGTVATIRSDRDLLRAYAQDSLPPMPSRWNGEPFGRVASAYMNARSEPSTKADIMQEMYQDDIVRVRRAVEGEMVFWDNSLWLETNAGYLFASFVQPMWYHLPNPPRRDLGNGRWAELTVPYSDAYWDPDPSNKERELGRMYYSSTFRVVDLVTGADGKAWYKVKEMYQSYYMRATHLRIFAPEELTPISPDLNPRDKWIDVNLAKQTLIAYEGRTPVFAHEISSGLPDHATPEGTHYIHDKRLSERMVGGTAAADDDSDRYNLAGVPFVCYFTPEWVALHGCYWHNDWGQPRSHGCVNLPASAARWVWRWTTPQAGPDEFYARPDQLIDGTRVEVHY